MKLLIDMPDEIYEILKNNGVIVNGLRCGKTFLSEIFAAIANGTSLSKGHKVIDAYALQEHLALVPMEDRTYREAVEIIDWFPSIIEADRRSENGKRRSKSKVDLLPTLRQGEM